MAEQTLTVHNSKLTYATLKKMVELSSVYTGIKTTLLKYFPEITSDNTQWLNVRNICNRYITNNINWLGSSPGSVSANQTSSYAYNIVNEQSMNNLIDSLNDESVILTSTVSTYTDNQIWFDILSKITKALNVEKEYTLHKQLFNAIKDVDDSVSKEPEQLIIYEDCEMPLPTNSQYPEKGNFHAYRQIFGDTTYEDILPSYSISSISLGDYLFDIQTNISTITINTSTYQHTPTNGYSVGCVLKATEVSDGTNLTTITYDAHDTFTISGFVTSAIVKILEISLTASVITGVTPIIEKPVITSPNAGITTYTPITFTSSTFAVSGSTFDLHKNSSWQIASDTLFSSVIHESLNDNINLTTYTLAPTGILNTDTTYYWRVKYTGSTYGDSDWSDTGVFHTSETYTCTLGASAGGGIGSGTINNNCIVVAPFDAEPTGTNTFRTAASEVLQLTPSVTLGDLTYRSDTEVYYINKTGANTSISTDWILIDPLDEPNHSMYVDSEVEQLALTVTTGNIAIRTDLYTCYVNINGTNTAMSDWILIDVPVKIWWLADQYCLNLSYGGYQDWYLPTASELNLLYLNRTTINTIDGTGNFITGNYWSKSVDVFDEKYNAWHQDFSVGTQSTKDRDTQWFYVRPVRRL